MVDPPTGSALTCHMVMFLMDAGLSGDQLVADAELLRASGSEAGLVDRGWTRTPDSGGYRIYELGNPVLHEDGQRALFAGDGSITLVTMASANGGFVQTIQLDPDGVVLSNTVEHIPALSSGQPH